ncbi:hypothetical protein K9N50_02750 [bacterium]|nr:hypothetical protein [bacterium]
MNLFPDIVRDIDGPKTNSQLDFEFLNRSSRSLECDIRSRLEDWFSRYPQDEQYELATRFNSDDESLQSAFFELALHELLINLGYEVTVHPDLQGTDKHPDFHAINDGNDEFYLEAYHFSGKSRKEKGYEQIKNNIYDDLNSRINSPDFFIDLDISGEPTTQPKWKSYIPALQQFIDAQDYNTICQAFRDGKYHESPSHIYDHEDLRIEFWLIPKSEAYRGSKNVRNLGVTEEWNLGDLHENLRNKIHLKAKKYGRLNKPIIIAVSHIHIFDRIDIKQALFGDEQYFLNSSSNRPITNEDLVFRRRLNGLLRNYTRVSGVLVVGGFTPWVTSEASIRLYQNPWAIHPCPSDLSVFPQAVVQNNQLIYEDGESLQSFYVYNVVYSSKWFVRLRCDNYSH